MHNIKNESEALKKEFEKERKERNEAKKSQEQQQSRAADRDEMPCYKMDAKPRGKKSSVVFTYHSPPMIAKFISFKNEQNGNL